MNLFQIGSFILHSNAYSRWKVDCDALTDEDITCLALMASWITPPFSVVEGVPSGGLRFAKAMESYLSPEGGYLIVDDVLTTGKAMYDLRMKVLEKTGREAIGLVIFARGALPNWVDALWRGPGVV